MGLQKIPARTAEHSDIYDSFIRVQLFVRLRDTQQAAGKAGGEYSESQIIETIKTDRLVEIVNL